MKPIPGIPGYYATKDGNIFSKKRSKLLQMKTQLDRDGYRLITFNAAGIVKRTHKVSRIIARTFLDNFTDSCTVMHLDNNRSNDNTTNLKVGSFEENNLQKIMEERQARGERCKSAKLTPKEVLNIKMLLKKGALKAHLAKAYGVSKTAIGYIANGRTWKHINN